jgi:hypothetical protein
MLTLDLSNAPRWLELLPGLRLKLRPLGTALMVAARADPEVEALPPDAGTDALGLAMAKAVARRAVLDWEGVGDASGAPLPVTPEGVDALLEVFPVFEAFQTAYVAKGLALELEKNVSSPSPNGASAGAAPTATPARGRARSARAARTDP